MCLGPQKFFRVEILIASYARTNQIWTHYLSSVKFPNLKNQLFSFINFGGISTCHMFTSKFFFSLILPIFFSNMIGLCNLNPLILIFFTGLCWAMFVNKCYLAQVHWRGAPCSVISSLTDLKNNGVFLFEYDQFPTLHNWSRFNFIHNQILSCPLIHDENARVKYMKM